MLERIRELIRGKLGDSEFEVLPAESAERGHFSTNAAFVLAKETDVPPIEAAKELKEYLEKKGPSFAPASAEATAGEKATAGKADFFSKIEVADPGFLNFWLTPEVIRGELEKIVEAGEKWGRPFDSAQGKVIVEYSQPNIAKPLQAHHLRSTIIGDAIANILEFAGYEVIRWNYLGDWGTHFGKLIALTKRKEPKEEWINVMRDVQGSAAIYSEYRVDVEKEPDLENEAREEFKKLEEGDSENRKLWEESREASIEKLKELYGLLGVHFDEWIGEAHYEGELSKLIQGLEEKGIARESEGAIIVPLEKYNLPPALIRKSDGATLYLTRDIASLRHRIGDYKAELVIYVVDNSQTLHFQQLFAIANILEFKGKFEHVKFGLLLGKDLKKLSSRAGTGIELNSVINEAVERARKIIEEKQPIRQAQGGPDMSDEEKNEVAEIIGIGALKYNDLSQSRVADIAFDWDKMLSLQGNSAPYLQYTYARLKSILRKVDGTPAFEVKVIEKEADLRLVLKLAYFPEVVKAVSENYLPHQIANYLYDLARSINDYYEKEPILKTAEPELRAARIHLVKSSAEILKTGLSLLGIRTVERM